jgi:isopentenyl diphosphate isomerase/L-lactate dehydrogenase-like FMN-dependent dehydrogenase
MRIDNITPEPDKIKVEASKQQQKETQKKLLATIRPHKGHTLYEINVLTGDTVEAEFEQVNAHFGEVGTKVRKQVITKENCFYISALNKKNAILKFHRFMKKKIGQI